MDRNQTIAAIKTGLKHRSGKTWSVTGGKGTAYGWLRITSTPSARRFDFDGVSPARPGCGYMSLTDRQELATLLGLDRVDADGISIPSSWNHYREYIDRAEGRTPSVIGTPYWD